MDKSFDEKSDTKKNINEKEIYSSDELSDSYYKNKFRFKKNSIEIKKKSLLKNKLKNSGITEIKKDIILIEHNNIPEKKREILCFRSKKEYEKNENIDGKKIINDNKNNTKVEKTKRNNIYFLNDKKEKKNCEQNEPSKENINEIYTKIENEYEYKNDDEELKNEIKITFKDNNNEKKAYSKSQNNKKNEKIKLKNNSGDKKNYKYFDFENGNIKNNEKLKLKKLKEGNKNEEISHLDLIKNHGRLINNIEEIYINNNEEIQNVRNDFSILKNELNKIMRIINIGQKAVASLK